MRSTITSGRKAKADKAAAIADQFSPKAETEESENKAEDPEKEIRWDTPANPKAKRGRKPLKKKAAKPAKAAAEASPETQEETVAAQAQPGRSEKPDKQDKQDKQ